MKRICGTILLFVFILMSPAEGFATDCDDYETKIHWQSSLHLLEIDWIHGHDLSWPWVYSLASGRKLVVTNVTDPDNPEIATVVELPNTGEEVKFEQDHLFICGGSRYLSSVDVSNPLQPVFRDSILVGPATGSLHIADGKAWIGSYYNMVTVVDISDPDNLAPVTKIKLDHPVEAIQVCGGLTYIGSDHDWCIYDLSNPTTPQELLRIPEEANSFTLQGETLIVGRQQEIATYDVSNPANPVLISTLATDYDVVSLISNNGMVLSHQTFESFVDFFWLQDDGTLEEFSRFRASDYYYCTFMLTDQHVYYGTDQYLHLLDLGNLQPVSGGDPVNTPGLAIDTKIANGYAFSAAEYNGLVVFDVEDPLNPVFSGSGFTSHQVRAVAIRDDLAFLVGDDAMTVFNISDPTLPWVMGHTDGLECNYPSDILLHQDTVWLARVYGHVSAVDISNPASPQPLATMDFDAVGLAQSQGYLHTIDEDGTYRVLSLDTMPPQEVASLSLTIGGCSIDIQGNHALIGHGWYGLSMLDISDPTNPVLLNHIKVMDGANIVTFRGDTAIVSNYRCTHVMDVSDPMNIRTVGTVWDGGFDHAVFPDGEILISHGMGEDYSIQVYPAPCSDSHNAVTKPVAQNKGLAIQPNPFNPQTIVSFSLPATAAVTVRIYDLTGRLVQTLASGEIMSAGLQSWTWLGRDAQGRNVSSGVYLVRLEAGQFQATGRMVLVR